MIYAKECQTKIGDKLRSIYARNMEIKYVKIDDLKFSELGWLAGIIDGEGSIGFKRSKQNRQKKTYIRYSPLIQISNCDVCLLNEVKRILDLIKVRYSFWMKKENQRNPQWQNSGNISIYSFKDARKFLEIILPYLIAKKERAKILLEFCYLYKGEKKRIKGKFITNKIGKEEFYWKKLHKLNKKGKR